MPLFVEELTEAVLEAGLLREEGNRYVLEGPLPPLAIPDTLHGSLLARLDRLAPVKEVAQVGAVIGREFDHGLLAAVAGMDETRLVEALRRLVEAELVLPRGVPPEATYAFKHALVRDAAYQSLLKRRRQQLHGRIAESLEEASPQTAARQPELLAYHFTEAGLADRAVAYWHRAGRQAMARSSMAEAVVQLREGLKALQGLPDGPERHRQELGLQVALGQALTAAKGYSAPETGRAYARARELCRQAGDGRQLHAVLLGQSTHHLVRDELHPARDAAEELLRSAEQDDDRAATASGHRSLGLTLCLLGEPIAARERLERALALYDPATHRPLALSHVHDPRVAGLCWLSRTLFTLGYPDQALARVREAGAAARELAHPYTTALALAFGCSLRHLLRDRPGVEEQAARLIAVCAEQGFPFWLPLGRFQQGWALAEGGHLQAGIATMREGLAAYRATGAGSLSGYLLVHLAEAHGKAGDAVEGLAMLAEALARGERSGGRWYEAEVRRLQAKLLLGLPRPDPAEAQACLHRAIEIAREQGARIWELRAATDLARLRADRGERREARDLLAPVHAWFTEGFDTPDLRDARALLETLG